jgi:hypothetical protein
MCPLARGSWPGSFDLLLALAAQCRLPSRVAVLAASAGATYAAFMLQVPVLLSLEIATRPFPWPPVVKAVLVGTLAIAASISLGWLLGEA